MQHLGEKLFANVIKLGSWATQSQVSLWEPGRRIFGTGEKAQGREQEAVWGGNRNSAATSQERPAATDVGRRKERILR